MATAASAARANTGASVYSSDNVRHLSRMELPGGGQIVIQGKYAYVGHQHRPDGTTIIDISDPRRPVVVSKLMTSHPWSHSHKVRVVDDLMVVNSEIEPGAGDRLAYPDGGFRVYDVSDKTRPKLITFVKTHARGVHRFRLSDHNVRLAVGVAYQWAVTVIPDSSRRSRDILASGTIERVEPTGDMAPNTVS